MCAKKSPPYPAIRGFVGAIRFHVSREEAYASVARPVPSTQLDLYEVAPVYEARVVRN